MKTALKKSKFVFVGLIISLFIFVTPAHAAAWNAWFQTQFSIKTVTYSISCEIIGCGLGEKPATADSGTTTPTITYNENPHQLGGILGFGTSTMIALYDNPPTSSTYYLANIGKEFGIDSAYAQSAGVSGSGAGLIKPVEQLWQILRNVSYMFFILIFVSIGFMIMLRQKLNAQTVITVQSALPGLVIGLVLVTFSYFIAALITDSAFFGVQIVAQIFGSVVNDKGELLNFFNPLDLAQKSNIFDMFTAATTSAPQAYQSYPEYFRTLESAKDTATNNGTVITAIVGGIVYAFAGQLLAAGTTAIAAGAILVAPLIVTVVLLIAFVIQFLKLIFKLLMAYIMILLTTALGPLYITLSMLPGKGGMLGMWWKTILGNALVFPAVFALFLFAGLIMKTDPEAWKSTPPLLGNFSTQLIQPIIAFVILLGAPAVPDMVKKAIGASDVGAIGSTGTAGFMAGYGAGAGMIKKGAGTFLGPLDHQREAYQKAYATWLATGGNKPKYPIPSNQPWWKYPVNAAVRQYVTRGTK